MEAQKALDNEVVACGQLREGLVLTEQEYASLTVQIDSIPAERLDIKNLLETRSSLEKKIEKTDINIVDLKSENVGYNEKLKEYDDFLTTIDIEDLLIQKQEYDAFKQKY